MLISYAGIPAANVIAVEHPATGAVRRHARTYFTQSHDPRALRGARVGVARKFFGFNDQVDKLMADAIDLMKREGATVVDPADLPTHGKFDAPEFEVLLFEFRPRSIIPVSLAAVTATAVRIAFVGTAPVFAMPLLARPSEAAPHDPFRRRPARWSRAPRVTSVPRPACSSGTPASTPTTRR